MTSLIAFTIMLKSLDDPRMIGPITASGLLIIVYSVFLAEFVITPIKENIDNSRLQQIKDGGSKSKAKLFLFVGILVFFVLLYATSNPNWHNLKAIIESGFTKKTDVEDDIKFGERIAKIDLNEIEIGFDNPNGGLRQLVIKPVLYFKKDKGNEELEKAFKDVVISKPIMRDRIRTMFENKGYGSLRKAGTLEDAKVGIRDMLSKEFGIDIKEVVYSDVKWR